MKIMVSCCPNVHETNFLFSFIQCTLRISRYTNIQHGHKWRMDIRGNRKELISLFSKVDYDNLWSMIFFSICSYFTMGSIKITD